MTTKNIQFTTFLSITLLMAYFGLTGTAYAVSDTIQEITDIYNSRPCVLIDYRTGEEISFLINLTQAQTLKRLCEIESRLTDVERQVGQLILKIDGLEAQVKNQPNQPVENKRIEAVEQRVSVLERAVSSLQSNVLAGLNRVISILEKLLKR